MRPNHSGFFTPEENDRLSRAVIDHVFPWIRAANDPEFNLERHKSHGCKWWRRGVGMVIEGEWSVSPAHVLVERER